MHVTLIAAQSLDGWITRHEEPGSAFTSAEDKAHFRASLREFDCRIMGANTFRATRELARKGLRPGHVQIVLTRNPEAFASEALPGQLEFSSQAPSVLLAELERRGYRRCALLGGSQIHTLFLEEKAVDELWITVEPVLFGTGTPLLARATEIRLKRLTETALSPDTLLLKYAVIRS